MVSNGCQGTYPPFRLTRNLIIFRSENILNVLNVLSCSLKYSFGLLFVLGAILNLLISTFRFSKSAPLSAACANEIQIHVDLSANVCERTADSKFRICGVRERYNFPIRLSGYLCKRILCEQITHSKHVHVASVRDKANHRNSGLQVQTSTKIVACKCR
jgi:hypothetical protein